MGSPATFVILAEDSQHEVFLRTFLVKIGHNPRRFRPVLPPRGVQSGEQFVRESYPAELQLHRQRSSRLDVKFFVVTDADTLTVPERHRQLSRALSSGPDPARGRTNPSRS